MVYVYILQSTKVHEQYYIGITENLKRRFAEHNSKNHKYSQRLQPWIIKNYFAFKDSEKAQLFEIYLKTSSGRAFSKKHF